MLGLELCFETDKFSEVTYVTMDIKVQERDLHRARKDPRLAFVTSPAIDELLTKHLCYAGSHFGVGEAFFSSKDNGLHVRKFFPYPTKGVDSKYYRKADNRFEGSPIGVAVRDKFLAHLEKLFPQATHITFIDRSPYGANYLARMGLTQEEMRYGTTIQSFKEALLEEKKLVCKKERNNRGTENLIIN
jgi:hypothetical protein